MYVDDFLSGADSVEECCTMVKDAISVMSQASMPLVKWGSNSPEVAEILHRDFRDKYLDRESFKVLGLLWLASDDCFTFRGSVLAPDLCITKRVVLSFFSKLFDPLGFAAPYVLQAKCLFQELWTLELGWDDEVPPEYQMRFLRWWVRSWACICPHHWCRNPGDLKILGTMMGTDTSPTPDDGIKNHPTQTMAA